MKLPSVSICIPTWNRAELVCRAVASALSQDYPGNLEVVVADDGSTDDTAARIEALKHLPSLGSPRRVRYFPGSHGGIARAKNRALLGAAGELRGILDSDDYYEPRFVSRCVDALAARPDVGLVYTDNWSRRRGKAPVVERAIDWSLDGLLRTCNIRGDCWLARWSVLSRTRLHDERMKMELDYDLFYQAAKLAPFLRVPEPLMSVVQHAGRTTRNREEAAYWHACCLAKHGFSIEYARERARRSGESWLSAVESGYAKGLELRDEDLRRDSSDVWAERGDVEVLGDAGAGI